MNSLEIKGIENLVLLRLLLRSLWGVYDLGGISMGRGLCSALLEAITFSPIILLPQAPDLMIEAFDAEPTKFLTEANRRSENGQIPINLETYLKIEEMSELDGTNKTTLALMLVSHINAWHHLPDNYMSGHQLAEICHLFVPSELRIDSFDKSKASKLLTSVNHLKFLNEDFSHL